MIKFFRKIRQKLLSENKFSKYLIYAIGEIVLVIIGILIALQINNNNTLRKETQELYGYLTSIKNNIASDKKQIEQITTFRDSIKFYSQKMLQLSQQNEITRKDIFLTFHDDYNVFFDNYLEINPSGFEALKNSGFLGKIQGSNIEKLINDYYLLVNRLEKQEKSLNDFIENMEVLTFEDKIWTKITSIVRRPDAPQYLKSHQEEIKTLINHPGIQGASLRASMYRDDDYETLLSLGEELTIEIENAVNK
ncbi:DUF6090 family protein [Flavobacteriaceae bacterium S0862]|jgi:hypothetical protein|nr:DUF6090 family protein [Flavobacteriaceae bacterium S0862]